MITNCGFRKSVLLFGFLDETLGWNLPNIPCFNSVENWIKKSGYSVYNNPQLALCDSEYGFIVDESIMVGNERMILTLGIKAEKTTEEALDYSDIEVVGIHVDSNWDASKIADTLKEDEKKMGKKSAYIISDNDTKLRKAIAHYGSTHILDIGHTLAMLLKRIYDKETDFCDFFKQIGKVKIKEVMSDCSYLLPPRQRTIARFMNLSHTIVWCDKIIKAFESFTEEEKQVYRFVVENQNLVSELHVVFECVNKILSKIKTVGLSYDSIGSALILISKELMGKSKRVEKFAVSATNYLVKEAVKLPDSKVIFNASSDMIESAFGCYKFRKSRNALHGVTAYVLILPLLTKMRASGKGLDTNVKANLEEVYMRDLHQWKTDKLTKNQAVKRRNKLAA